jgi:hypothetical protein
MGAKAAVAIVLGQRLQKSKSVTTSNWASAELKPNQLLYAANDAYAALCVFRALGSPYAPTESPTPNPSSGRPPVSYACLRPPLMSNVRRHKKRVQSRRPKMHEGSCHCGAVRMKLPSTPQV